MQAWTEMWKLELDHEKSYIWTSEAGARKEAKMLGWNVVRSAKDLGAQLNYGRSKSIKTQTQRFTSLVLFGQSFDAAWLRTGRSNASCDKLFGQKHFMESRSAPLVGRISSHCGQKQ